VGRAMGDRVRAFGSRHEDGSRTEVAWVAWASVLECPLSFWRGVLCRSDLRALEAWLDVREPVSALWREDEHVRALGLKQSEEGPVGAQSARL
jgi:hypothetical protein